ncbi:MAG: sulfatase [Kiritimatiellales bacterium]
MNGKLFLSSLASLSAASAVGVKAAEQQPPNIVFILADDCAYNSLSCYGGQNLRTENIDRLASEGIRFSRAYASTSMCVPFRHELYTGLYPMRNGSVWNHSATRPGLKSAPHYLGDLGYRVGLTGKYHVYPSKNFPFEDVPGFEKNCVAQQNRYAPEEIIPFLTRDRKQPFCLIVGSTNPHRPWTMGDAGKFDRAALKLPPAVADTDVVREDYAHYLAEVERLDQQVGDVLDILEKEGLADNTVVMFSSEQGWQFLGGKWNCWDLSLHTALLARWPGHIQPGQVTGAMVQICDILPTLIDIAGGNSSKGNFDGKSFLPVLIGKAQSHRDFVFGLHNNVPEGKPYPIRTIRDENFRLIMNLEPDRTYIGKFINGQHKAPWFSSIKKAAEGGDMNAERLAERFLHRPAEELYRPDQDPFELNNLAANPEYNKEKEKLKSHLLKWMAEQQDPGAEIDRPSKLEENRKSFGWRQ